MLADPHHGGGCATSFLESARLKIKDFPVARLVPLSGAEVIVKRVIVALAMVAASVVPMAAAVRGAVVVGRPFYGGGFYAPYWGSYWGPSWVGPSYAYPDSGQVKLDTKVKSAEVFVNGAYAGTTGDNKTMRLRPGQYNIEIREGGQSRFAQRVFVVSGKTLRLSPML